MVNSAADRHLGQLQLSGRIKRGKSMQGDSLFVRTISSSASLAAASQLSLPLKSCAQSRTLLFDAVKRRRLLDLGTIQLGQWARRTSEQGAPEQ